MTGWRCTLVRCKTGHTHTHPGNAGSTQECIHLTSNTKTCNVWSLNATFGMSQFSSKSKCRTTFPSKTKVAETFPTLSGPRKHSTQVFWTSGTQDFELCFDRTPVRVVLILLCCEICHAVAGGSISQQSAQSLHFQKCALLPPLVIKTARLSVALI